MMKQSSFWFRHSGRSPESVIINYMLTRPDNERHNLPQRFDLGSIRTLLNITEVNTSGEEVLREFKSLFPKFDGDQEQGFYAWVEPDNLGHLAVYNKGKNGESFILKRTVLNGKLADRNLDGIYQVSGHKIFIDLMHDVGSPFVTCHIFLNDTLIAARLDPFDESVSQAHAFLESSLAQSGKDPSRLAKTVEIENSPYPFALKMLRDFSDSQVDKGKTKKMFQQMGKNCTMAWKKDSGLRPE